MMTFRVAHPGKAAIAVDDVVIDDAVAEDEDAWIDRMSAECVAQKELQHFPDVQARIWF